MKRNLQLQTFGIMVILAATTLVTATSSTFNAPLYTYRMEQVSNRMNFLCTEMNRFSFEARDGFTVNCNVQAVTSAQPLSTDETCEGYSCFHTMCYETCEELSCMESCVPTCIPTEDDTCMTLCYTCSGYTCDQTSCQNTCVTCSGPTCIDTCQQTCSGYSCDPTSCQRTCRLTSCPPQC